MMCRLMFSLLNAVRGPVVLASLLAAFAADPASAQCLDSTALSRVAARREYWQPVEQVAVHGNIVYVAAGSWIVAEVDGTPDFVNVTTVGSQDYVHRIARGSYFYVTATPEGWVDFRLATTGPTGAKFGSVNTPGGSVGLAIDGDYVYVADAPGGLVTTNAAGLTGPELVSMVPGPPGGALAVDTGGGLAAVVGDADLWLYDLAMPGLPQVTGQVALSAGTTNLDLVGSTVYVAGAAGLQIWDVSLPATPVLVGSVATTAPLLSVRADGDRVLAPAADENLVVIDVSDPAAPTVTGSLAVPGVRQVDLVGDLVVAACGLWDLVLIDLGTAWSPAPLTTVPHGLGPATDGFEVAGDRGWLLQEGGGFQVIDLSDPAQPVPGVVVTPPSAVRDLEEIGGVLYAGTATGLRLYSLANPANPLDLGEIPNYWGIESICATGSTVCVLDMRGTIRIYDATNPANPFELAVKLTNADPPAKLVCSSDILYVAEDSAVWVYDISNPVSPLYIGNRGGVFVDCLVRDQQFIGLTTDNDVLIRDYTDPAAPVTLGSMFVGDTAQSFALAGDIAYVGCASGVVRLFDISDPNAITTAGDLVFPAGQASAFRFPYLYGVAGGAIAVQHLACASLAALDCDANGQEDSAEIAAHPARDWNGDGVLDTCQQGQGLSDVPGAATSTLVLRPARPNPFNPRTALAFELASAGRVTVNVHDVRGRLVRRLVTAVEHPRGVHDVSWDGRDDHGRLVASGPYWYRVQVDGESATGRVVMLK